MTECIGLIAGHSGDSLTDVLHKRGYEVALVAGKDKEPGCDRADYVLVTDVENREEIESFFADCRVDFVLIGTGHEKVFRTAEYLESKGFELSIDIKASRLAKNKKDFKKFLREIDVNTPNDIVIIHDRSNVKEIDSISVPCVVKSVVDVVQPQKVNDRNELKKAIEELLTYNEDILIEQYIEGGDCTVAVANNGRDITCIDIINYSKAKEYRLKGFDAPYVATLNDEQKAMVKEISIKIAKEVGFKGVIRVDFIIDEDIYVLEANSVIVTGYKGSAYPFFKEQGYDIAEIAVDTALEMRKTNEF